MMYLDADFIITKFKMLDIYSYMKNIFTPLSYDTVPDTIELDKLYITKMFSYGYPISYIQEQNGRHIQNLFPIKSNEIEQISSSSKATLQLHTEAAFHPYSPDIISLLCVREDLTAGTTYSYIGDVLKILEDSALKILQNEQYSISLDKSFISLTQKDSVVPITILSKDNKFNTKIWYDSTLISSPNKKAASALRSLSVAITTCCRTVILRTGDLLMFDNKRVIHGRTSFVPRYDGHDRWIKRLVVLRKLPPESEWSYNNYNNIVISTQLGNNSFG